jgi:carboxyl-terminal processing protease
MSIFKKLVTLSIFVLLSSCNDSYSGKNKELKSSLDFIHDNFVDKLNEQEFLEKTLKGLLKNLDKYSDYYGKQEFNNIADQLRGNFFGIGVELKYIKDQGMEIVNFIGNSPASRSGVMIKDLIVEVDNQNIINKDAQIVVCLIKNSTKDTVKLKILRDKKYLDFLVKKENIDNLGIVTNFFDDIAYLKIGNFNQTYTLEKVKSFLSDLHKNKNCKGLVIDLRDNFGGVLETAISIANLLLEKGKIIIQIKNSNDNRMQPIYTDQIDITKNIKIVVLVNQNSASASEVLTASLKDNNRATIVGEKTLGKGTIQILLPIKSGEMGGFKLTIMNFYTPFGNTIDGSGIEPDICVKDKIDQDLAIKKALSLLKTKNAN